MNKFSSIIFIIFLVSISAKAQGLLGKKEEVFTRQDTLRGSITPERAWWDLKHYHLDIKVNPADSTDFGFEYRSLQSFEVLQSNAN